MDAQAKIVRAIRIGELIQRRKCSGFSSPQLRAALRALSEIRCCGECTPEQSGRISKIELYILTQLDARGDTLVWSRREETE